MIPMPVLPRRRDEIHQTVEELKRRELDDASGSRPRGLPAAARPDPAGGFVPGQHVTDAGNPAVRAAAHGEPFKREGRPGAIPQQVFETPKIARHIAVEERDSDTHVDGKPAVLPGEHVGGGRRVEQASEPEPADHAAADPLGERGQSVRCNWPGRQERRRCVTPCLVDSRHEDAVGHARVEMHVVVDRRAEAVQEGDATGPRTGGTRHLGIRGPA
jgi:hypothetical protein